jgi:hypothetical protein
MKKFLLLLALLPSLCIAKGEFVNAVPMDNSDGKTCKVFVSDYKQGSDVRYLGNCTWFGLSGTAAYVQNWNFSNHIKIVRANFQYGQIKSYAKVTYINRVNKTIYTYDEFLGYTDNVKNYNLDDILADASQAGLAMDNNIMAYIKFANYIDTME